MRRNAKSKDEKKDEKGEKKHHKPSECRKCVFAGPVGSSLKAISIKQQLTCLKSRVGEVVRKGRLRLESLLSLLILPTLRIRDAAGATDGAGLRGRAEAGVQLKLQQGWG